MIELVVFDLDNVIIDGEAIDEIGKLVNVEEKVAEITEQAMSGDLEFETSLKERVKLLKGASVEEIKKIASEMELMKGAKETINTLKDKGYDVAIISGSFDLITDSLKDKIDFDHIFTNTLVENDGTLTGEVTGPLVKGSKFDILSELIKDKNISLKNCVAVGDGANDISMIEAAEYGIAFNAKPAVKEAADIIVEKNDLTEILTIITNLNPDENVEDIKSENVDEEMNETVEIATNDDFVDETSVKEDVALDEDNETVEAELETVATEKKEETEISEDESDVSDSSALTTESSKDSQDNEVKKFPESSFKVADTPEGVRRQKDEKEALIAKIAEKREEFNNQAKEQRKIRDELNDSLKENLKLAIEFRDKRNEINKEVEENKKLRDKVNEELKNLEWSSGRRDKLKLENEIKKIDKVIETRVLDIKKENQLVKNANDLRKELSEIKEDDHTKEEAQKLKKTSEEYHLVVVDLSEKAQESHENMLNYFRKTDEIRTNADEAHKLFIEARKSASLKHEEFKTVLSEIHQINKKLGSGKSKRRRAEKQSSNKKNREEKERAEDIFDKFKKGKKLTTEELLLLQKHDIS
ncbi:MAG: phosphoserine phosphatase SerB [Methanobacteriaceae archaeon]|nr:phosphoserine phosphatase SerB [Candidatus Methanorudis spinitermitis]